ncbi:DUF3592 domain-containing protein [Herbiconiux sp.]|uniref:DUF3592 domain-containing protein n=1 Tax=Herbiconiux sp. TaxID=1871186 RepID=UPI0025BF4095|nr:DUF3592 domain-containing protein [Herbiconiux sp.]
MQDPVGALSLILELFSWIGIAAGLVLLVVGLVRGAFFRGWRETLGVVVLDASGDLVYRWLGEDGVLYEAPSIDDDTQVLEPGEDVTVYVNPRDPSVGRVDDPTHEGRALRTTGWILLGLGIVAVVVQFVLLFL